MELQAAKYSRPYNLPGLALADPATNAMERLVRAIPKVELHCHLLGTVRRQTFEYLVRREGHPIPMEEVAAFYNRGEKPVGAIHVLRALDALLIKSADDLYRLTIEYLEDAAAHNVRYAEFFWNPTGTAKVSGIGYGKAADAIVRAIRDGHAQFGIEGRVVPSIDREASPAAAVEMVQWMRQYPHDECIGIGIDYREEERPPEMFAEAFALARSSGFKATAHASEFGISWHNVRAALDVLKVDRIDHGYTIVSNPELARECVERGIVFTVVPTNTYYLRILPPERWASDHPIRKMAALGLAIHPNSDDPTLHQVTPTQAWMMMAVNFGFGVDQLRQLMLNGVQGAWVDETTKKTWRKEWTDSFDLLTRTSMSETAIAGPIT
jgi:adenine deaminase